MDILISIASFLLVVMIMVFVHEWGHFYMARLCGVKVDVFAIGFGKKLWSKIDRHGTEWKINILPLGGYVKMFGDAGPASDADLAKVNSMTEEEKNLSFFHKKMWQKALIVFAGPFMNYFLAFVILFGLLLTYGDLVVSNKISAVADGGPAATAGLTQGDEIVAINSQSVSNIMEIQSIINKSRDNKEISMTVEREGIQRDISITPEATVLPNGERIMRIGIMGSVEKVQYSISEAAWNSLFKIYIINKAMIDGIKKLVTGNGSKEELGGPIKIAQVTGEAMKQGLQSFLGLLVLLSINLGLVNLLPIPGLDGGHLMYYLLGVIKPIPQEIQIIGIKIGFMLLITLIIFVTYNDIVGLLSRI